MNVGGPLPKELFMKNYSYCAIKTKDTEKTIELIEEYLAISNLHIVEERIGDRKGKYATSPHHYNTLEEYDKDELYKNIDKRFTIEFQTAFSIFEPTSENPEWTILYFQPFLAKKTTDMNSKLAKYLSQKLHTTTYEYNEYSVVDWYIASTYEDGALQDQIQIGDQELDSSKGIFNDLATHQDEEDIYEQVIAKIKELENKLGLDSTASDDNFLRNERRPMYIKGPHEKISEYLDQQSYIDV